MPALSSPERERLDQDLVDASVSVAQSWPLKTFAYRNPLRGLEHLPFDEAIRGAKHALGGDGYLSNDGYLALYRSGAITDAAITQALQRFETNCTENEVQLGSRKIRSIDVLREHLTKGFDKLDPTLLSWTLQSIESEDATSAELWASTLAVVRHAQRLSSHDPPIVSHGTGAVIDLPVGRTLSDWIDLRSGSDVVNRINDQMIKWLAAFLDEGMSSWQMPGRKGGFYQAWRELARRDLSGRFWGIRKFGRKVRDLPKSPEDAIAESLARLGIPRSRWTEYLGRQFAQLPGWAGFVRWRSENPDYPAQRKHPIDAAEYLAVRLFYEVELVEATCRREWRIDGTLPAIVSAWPELAANGKQLGSGHESVDEQIQVVCSDGWRMYHLAQHLELTPENVSAMSADEVSTLLDWIDTLPSEDHGAVWLEALETSYRDRLLAKLARESTKDADHEVDATAKVTDDELGTLAQFVFCIDVRSEPMRRQIEAKGRYDTFGFAGFFGIPISYQPFDSHDPAALCPVILSPQFAVDEVPRSGQKESLQTYATSSRWHRLGAHLFHDLKRNVLSSFLLIDVLGLFFSALLVGKTYFGRAYDSFVNAVWNRFSRPIATRIPVDLSDSTDASFDPQLPHGFTLTQRAAFVGNALKAIGLTEGMGRFVVLCGHGSTSENNPYFAAYNCGACGGGHGDANARVFAAMANDPEVRSAINETGLPIPDGTWFIAAKHNTVTDSIAFYDQEELPASHHDDFQRMVMDVELACAEQASDRIVGLPQAPGNLSVEEAREHMLARSADWANVRPEWGLSGNAAFILGRRSLTDGVDLEGRVFLQSYDPDGDPDGGILEALMTAPLVVAQWISMEYYFSAVDPECYGSGSKVTHNVVSGIGVMHGAHGDLQSGLPMQSVNDGTHHYHQPVRLLAIIESPTSRIDAAVEKHVMLQQLLNNQWIHLVAVNPADGERRRFVPNSSLPNSKWESVS